MVSVEPEGVKFPLKGKGLVFCGDPEGATIVADEEMADPARVTPTNSPPPSPISLKSQLVVSGMATPSLVHKEDPPEQADGSRPGTPELAKRVRASVEATKCPMPCVVRPSPNTSPSSKKKTVSITRTAAAALANDTKDHHTKEWSRNELGLDAKRELPPGWKPSPNSVICGRGKDCFEAEGNKRFRAVINSLLDEYVACSGKSQKSKIVTKALNIVREANPEGAFVKSEKGQWHEVSLKYAREKVGAWFRDCLSHRYKSSSKAKHAKKMAERGRYECLVDPNAVFNFPKNFAQQLREHEHRSLVLKDAVATLTKVKEQAKAREQALIFYDIDDLEVIPFDSVDC